MTQTQDTVAAVAQASWPARVALIRTIPENFGTAQHADIYSSIAAQVYVPNLKPDFGYVHWREEYELGPIEVAYNAAHDLTQGFIVTDMESIASAILEKGIIRLTYQAP